jgi:putative nucleotidyltransferase with HDIG domain
MQTLDKQLIKLLNSHNIEAWLCGGTVRDYILKKPIRNYDIAVNVTLAEILEKLQPRVINVNEYSTSAVIRYKETDFTLYPLKKVELVNTYYNFSYTSNLAEDASTRDFTINSIYYNPVTKEWVDPNNGRADIKNKILRFVGNPETRILESKVRLLRAATLLARLGEDWTIEDSSFNAIKANVLKLMTVNSKLVHNELVKLFYEANKPSIAFTFMKRVGMLEDFFPELQRTISIPQNNKLVGLDLFEHITLTMDSIAPFRPNTIYLRLAGLLHDIGKPYTEVNTPTGTHFYMHEVVGSHLAENIMYRWGFQRALIKKVCLLIQHHLFDAMTKSEQSIKKLILKVGPENIHDLLDLRIADRVGTGRPDITMTKIDILRARINTLLKVISPESFRFDINDNYLLAMGFNEEAIKPINYFLLQKIFSGKLQNKRASFRKAIISLKENISCPLGDAHLFNTWGDLQTASAEIFPDGNLKCGVYCNFQCNKYINKDDSNNTNKLITSVSDTSGLTIPVQQAVEDQVISTTK